MALGHYAKEQMETWVKLGTILFFFSDRNTFIMDSCEAHGQLAHKINHKLYISLLIQCTHLGWYGMDYFP